ncbi:hypothetical protein NKH74_33165 [Mesorhizobium sp. M0933]
MSPTATEPVDIDAEVSAFLARLEPKSPDMMPPSSSPTITRWRSVGS